MAGILERGLRVLETLTEWLVGALVIFLVGLVASQVVDRHFIDVPVDAPDQLARIAIVWLTFLGFALALRANVTIRIDILDQFLPRWPRLVLQALFDLAILALLILLIFKTWRIIEVGGTQIILGTPFTAALPNTGMFVGVTLMALFTVGRMMRRFANWRRDTD